VTASVLEHAGSRGVLAITHATDMLEGFDRVVRLDRAALHTVKR
jgi:ABC-type transport system involved in cytochrome bd biosynthesis fused ATPase/permease subunit